MLITTLHAVLLASGAAEVPEWVQLVPAGESHGRDGRGPYRLTEPAAVIARSMSNGPLPLDENHAIDLAAKTGEPSPARGWIVELQARADGLWGRVDWTPSGRALIAERAYRGISPVLAHAKDGTVLRVLRAALTNNPNLPVATLHHQGSSMDLTRLRAALGLAADADEAAILAAAEAARTAVSAHAQQLGQIAQAAGVTAASPDAAAILTALQARGAGAGGDAEALRLRTEMVALQTQLGTLQGQVAREKAVQAVDGAIRAGKPIPAALRDHYITRHMADPAAVEKELGGLPSLHAGGLGQRAAGGTAGGTGDSGLTPDEAQVVALLGVDPEKFKAARAKLGERVGGA